ncbi:DUF2147 domain-containing protein [Flavobacterium wongokense]|uniref:DUF2147 domain-containing protein n=1 Tax=Flavobacterium wongokense TaxID=2910674 RepID=UPI001F31BCF6|nr:DUF2147 domain-containing protein [Flavobacterium sp. WG47]MCF6132054.1 DUF2147 domain-containing protein [Flavobacterium sp. WG47]
MRITTAFFLILFFQISFGQSIFGKWKTIDDLTGKEKGIVEIYEYKGKVYGKIIEIFEADKKHLRCEKCEGEDRNRPILGMNIIKGLKRNDDVYEGGKIIDPKNGKSYHCKITLEGKDKLIVRGYIGISLFGRSQTWIRQK